LLGGDIRPMSEFVPGRSGNKLATQVDFQICLHSS
jgi:hypothetical protein